MNNTAHVNSVMKLINLYTDNIYESLMDVDKEELNKNIYLLTDLLKEIQQTFKEDI
jgi:hypothetical protein